MALEGSRGGGAVRQEGRRRSCERSMGGVGSKGALLERRITVAHGREPKIEDVAVLLKYYRGGVKSTLGSCSTLPMSIHFCS
jgi:hypothetical protein